MDTLAKQAAHEQRKPQRQRYRLQQTRKCALHYRVRLGAVTWASQSFEVVSSDHNGNPVKTTRRDSTGKPPGNAPPGMRIKRNAKQQRPLPAAAPPPPAAECPESEVREVSRFSRVTEAIDDLFSACKSKFGSSVKATGRQPQHGECPRTKTVSLPADEVARRVASLTQAAQEAVTAALLPSSSSGFSGYICSSSTSATAYPAAVGAAQLRHSSAAKVLATTATDIACQTAQRDSDKGAGVLKWSGLLEWENDACTAAASPVAAQHYTKLHQLQAALQKAVFSARSGQRMCGSADNRLTASSWKPAQGAQPAPRSASGTHAPMGVIQRLLFNASREERYRSADKGRSGS